MPSLRPRKKLMARVIPGTATISKQCRWLLWLEVPEESAMPSVGSRESTLSSTYSCLKSRSQYMRTLRRKNRVASPVPIFLHYTQTCFAYDYGISVWKVTATEKTDNKCETNDRCYKTSCNFIYECLGGRLSDEPYDLRCPSASVKPA